MSGAAPQPERAAPANPCSLCGAPIASGVSRCPSCGLHQSMGPEKPNPFTAASLWMLAGLLGLVYAATLVAVAAAR